MYSSFDVFSNRSNISAVEKYGSRSAIIGEIDKLEIYKGPSIRAFMTRNNLDPNQWRELLEYNNFGSTIDLVEGETQLAIPRDLI